MIDTVYRITSDQSTDSASAAIVVNCLPAFAILLRKKVISNRATGNSNSGPYTGNSVPLQPKSRVRAESVLLDDVAPVEAGRRSASSRDDSESWSHDIERKSKSRPI
jgi:hypothetical protein